LEAILEEDFLVTAESVIRSQFLYRLDDCQTRHKH